MQTFAYDHSFQSQPTNAHGGLTSHSVNLVVPVFRGSEAPIAYWQRGLEIRLAAQRLYRAHPSSPRPIEALDPAAIGVVRAGVNAIARSVSKLQPGDAVFEMRRAAEVTAIIDGQLWSECGEPVYRITVSRFGEPLAWGEVDILHAPPSKHIHDDEFPAHAFEEANDTLVEWLARGCSPLAGRKPWEQINVTGVHEPGTTWRTEAILNMPDPYLMTSAALETQLGELCLRLQLQGALPPLLGAASSVSDYDPASLTSAQEVVVLHYLEAARLAGVAVGGAAPLPRGISGNYRGPRR